MPTEIAEALESYSSHLEKSFVSIRLPPTAPGTSVPPNFDLSPSYADALDEEFTRVYEEYCKRLSFVQSTCEDIIKLWAELGTPQVQQDSAIVKYYRKEPEQLGLHESDLSSLRSKRDKLLEEKRSRERILKELRTAVEALWEKLGPQLDEDEADHKEFLMKNRSCLLRSINAFQDELARLNEQKKLHLHVFVEDARFKLQELWDSLYVSEEEMLDFAPAFSDVISDALLEALEAEIARLTALREQRAPTLHLVERHRSLLAEREALNASSQDASRLMNRGNKGEKRDPGKLLREEKMRKRIAKELPRVEEDLRIELEQWEEEYGRPFLVYGERYVDQLAPAAAKQPPRSKTPSAPSSTSKVNSIKQLPSRPATAAPRSAGKTPTSGTASPRRNYQQGSATVKSPSKIPSRAPLSNMPYGSNNPDRPGHFSAYTITGKMPSARAPIPARMRAMTTESKNDTPPLEHRAIEHLRSNSTLENSLVRSITPDDVYDDHQPSFISTSSIFSHQSAAPSSNSSAQYPLRGLQRPNPYLNRVAPPPVARHMSNSSDSSAVNTVVSGSENWETFDDGSGSETDSTEAYYNRLNKLNDFPNVPAKQRVIPGAMVPFGGQKNVGQFVTKIPKGIRSVSPD